MAGRLGQHDEACFRLNLLLDTCALINIAADRSFSQAAREEVDKAVTRNAVHISPVSAWELGKLASRGRLSLSEDPLALIDSFLEMPGVSLCALTPEIFVKSSFLPMLLHKDPIDLILIATARTLNLTLVTNDRVILAYGAEGHVKTLAF
jgi:PIN domain nuclease of toxin-antitoxin system